jgi:hypothetical protein
VPLLAMLLLYLFSTGRKPLEVKLRCQLNQAWTAFRIRQHRAGRHLKV